MKKSLFLPVALVSILILGGCVKREQADAKLANACMAAVNVFLDESEQIDHLKGSDFTASPEGPDFRHVTIHAVSIDGWLESESDYECIFQEGFGFMNSGYSASIYQVRAGDSVYGKSGNEILGDAEDHLKLNDAVRKALYEK